MILPWISSNSNISQLANIVANIKYKSNYGQNRRADYRNEKYIKCGISDIDKKIKSLHECLHGLKETEKSNEVLQKQCHFFAKWTNRK